MQNILKFLFDANKKYKSINQREAYLMMQSEKVVILDVRSEEEFSMGHLPNAINLPVNEINASTINQFPKNENLLVYCQSGMRAQSASQKLAELGFENVYEFGGIATWPYETVK